MGLDGDLKVLTLEGVRDAPGVEVDVLEDEVKLSKV